MFALKRIDEQYSTARTGLRCLAWAFGAYVAFGAIGQFAGRSTDVDLALSLVMAALVEVKLMVFIALTGTACAWAVVERTLRHRTVKRLQGRIRELETTIDPARSTSKLTPEGKTNPADRKRR
jgi:hypothetical protein